MVQKELERLREDNRALKSKISRGELMSADKVCSRED